VRCRPRPSHLAWFNDPKYLVTPTSYEVKLHMLQSFWAEWPVYIIYNNPVFFINWHTEMKSPYQPSWSLQHFPSFTLQTAYYCQQKLKKKTQGNANWSFRFQNFIVTRLKYTRTVSYTWKGKLKKFEFCVDICNFPPSVMLMAWFWKWHLDLGRHFVFSHIT
jgi:hypothetical protein